MEKNVDQSQHTSRSRKCSLDLKNFARDSRKDQKGLIKVEDLPLLETTQLTHTPFVLEATLAIPATKLSRRLNLLNGSQLYYKTVNCEKHTAFCSVTMYHPTVASPKENLYVYEQRASNPALTERNIQKPTLIFYVLVRSNTLWSIIAPYRVCTSCLACQHFEFNSADWFFSQ